MISEYLTFSINRVSSISKLLTIAESRQLNVLQEPGKSVWMLLSDSESCPEASPAREHDDIHPKELSGQKTSQYLDKKKGNVIILDETLEETSKKKSPIKKKAESQLSSKKKLDDHVKGGTKEPDICIM